MNHEFKLKRGHYGLSAETLIPLPEDCGGRTLMLTTSKGSRGLSAHASAIKVSEDTGSGFTSFSISLFGDYSKTVLTSPARATEKAIRELHTAALDKAADLIAEAQAFYTAKRAKETA